jgi:hypothetical protein
MQTGLEPEQIIQIECKDTTKKGGSQDLRQND